MKIDIQDSDALSEITPTALTNFAVELGWSELEPYGDHSTVYAAACLPEIILPRTRELGDYARVVARLIDVFASINNRDTLEVYRNLVTADRDVVRVRVVEGDGSLPLGKGVDLIAGVRSMLIATACSLNNPLAVYRRITKEATDIVNQVRLGQTEQGSYVVVLHTPVVVPRTPTLLKDPKDDFAPPHRRMTRRLTEALTTTREALERGTLVSAGEAMESAIHSGVSANLCESLVALIGAFSSLDIRVTWARTRPERSRREAIRFFEPDVQHLDAASRLFREFEPRPNAHLVGAVIRLHRAESKSDGNITLRAEVEGNPRSVTANLNPLDYNLAIQAHRDKAAVIVTGTLERVGEHWRLLNPLITGTVPPKLNESALQSMLPMTSDE